MTTEEAIKILGSGSWWDYLNDEMSDADFDPLDEALDKAIAALRAQQEVERNKALTLGKYEVTEMCPHCDNEITMIWDVQNSGHKAYCPVCGERLMLCDACQHSGLDGECVGGCDYDSNADTCKYNRHKPKEEN